MLVERTLLAAAIETVAEGTAVSLTNANAKFKPRDFKFKPGIEPHKPGTRRRSFSRFPSIPGKRMGTASFKIDMYGLTSGAAPAYEVFLQGCGLKKATNGSAFTYTVSSVWDPSTPGSSDHKSLTLAWYNDGVVQRLIGARGSVIFNCVAGKPISADFNFIGAIEDLADTALLSGISYDTASVTAPTFMGAGFSFGTLSAAEALISQLSIDLANSVKMRTDANASGGYRSAFLGSRATSMKFDPEYLRIAQGHDFWGVWKGGTLGACSFAISNSTDNTVSFSMPNCGYVDVSPEERDELTIAACEADCYGNSADGDDELVITLGTP